jgi:hypothetical protein
VEVVVDLVVVGMKSIVLVARQDSKKLDELVMEKK